MSKKKKPKKPSIYERIPNGGLPEKIPLEDAMEYAQLHIDVEVRDPNGLDREAKVYLALLKRIRELEEELKNAKTEAWDNHLRIASFGGLF